VVKEQIAQLPKDHRVAISAAMKDLTIEGLRACRHLGGDLYEVRAYAPKAHYRLIFSQEARYILLLLHVVDKDTRKLPLAERRVADIRLSDWRARG
jgi:phage-related protein